MKQNHQQVVSGDGEGDAQAPCESGEKKEEAGETAGASDASVAWRIQGHEWIGQRARRFFAEYGTASGVITRWLPADGDDEQQSSLHGR